jgi:hypothetical protein
VAEITDHVWSVGELIEAALKAVPTKPMPTPAQRRRQFRVIQGDLFDLPHAWFAMAEVVLSVGSAAMKRPFERDRKRYNAFPVEPGVGGKDTHVPLSIR